MKAKIVLLWDIDGTLISARGSGTAALCDALEAEFGIRSDLGNIEIQGRTDRWIFEQMIKAFKLPPTADSMNRLEQGYLDALQPQLAARGVEVLPGVRQILKEAAAREDVVQGLLTGNLIEGAKRKMNGLELWDFFPFGAFSDDAANRNELGPKAVQRAEALCGHPVDMQRVWVIGDTPHDVTCGKVCGARTMAVATGKNALAKLRESSPCAAFENFADTKAFWAAVEH